MVDSDSGWVEADSPEHAWSASVQEIFVKTLFLKEVLKAFCMDINMGKSPLQESEALHAFQD